MIRKTHEQFMNELSKLDLEVEVLGTYIKAKEKIMCRCTKCNYVWDAYTSSLLSEIGCPICSGKTNLIFIGVNDMWTTAPEIAKLLANPDDGYKYTRCSSKKVDWKCPNCGNIIKNRMIGNIFNGGLSCPKCSDGVSYPNKFMFSLLEQLHLNFITEYSPDWIKPMRYDFYIEINNKEYIIEMDGEWHSSNNNLSGITKIESQKVDSYKNILANNHNIEVVRINAIKSEEQYIKTSILNSNLQSILNLNIVDWDKCNCDALNSYVKIACDLWNFGYKIVDISKLMNRNRRAITSWLNKGAKCNLCYYNGKEEMVKNIDNLKLSSSKKVICITLDTVYDSISDAYRQTNITNISACCREKIKYAGRINNKKLVWMFYDDYINKRIGE